MKAVLSDMAPLMVNKGQNANDLFKEESTHSIRMKQFFVWKIWKAKLQQEGNRKKYLIQFFTGKIAWRLNYWASWEQDHWARPPNDGSQRLTPGSHNEVHNQETQISPMWLLGHSSFFLILGPGFLFGPFHLDLSLPKIWLLEAIHANSCHGICISHWLAPGKISTTITLF